jgi:hypothetical protein
MIHIIFPVDDPFVMVRASGLLTRADLTRLDENLSQIIMRQERGGLFFGMTAFLGLETELVFRISREDVHYLQYLSRLAVVGGGSWAPWMTPLVDGLLKADVRHFGWWRWREAVRWLQSAGRRPAAHGKRETDLPAWNERGAPVDTGTPYRRVKRWSTW